MLDKFKNKRDYLALSIIGVVGVITHFHWLFSPRIFSSGDWWYIGLEKYRDFVSFSPIWFSDGFGGTSATPSFYLIRFFEGLASTLGSTFILNEKLFFFLPIIIGSSFGAYIFLRQYFSQMPSFVGSVIFSFNTAILFNYAGALTIAVADAMTPIALFLFMQYLQNPRSRKLLFFSALCFAIMAAYELRITIIVLVIAAGYLLHRSVVSAEPGKYLKKRFFPLAKLGLLFVLFQAFWLIPYVVNAKSGVTFSDALGQGLFVSFSDLSNALTLQHPFWTGSRPATFVLQSIPAYAWLIPLLAFSGFVMARRDRRPPDIAFWVILSLCGLFLVKQVNAPFDGSYPWIFNNIPGFAAYREASKFYLLISLAYAVLIPYTLIVLKEKLLTKKHLSNIKWLSPKLAYKLVVGCVLALFLVNTWPLINGSFKTLYTPRTVPQEYATFNKFIDGQKDFFRVMWLPVNSRWATQSSVHPSVITTSLKQGYWLEDLMIGGLPREATLKDKALNVFTHSTSDDMLDVSSIKYVVVPLRDVGNEDNFFYYYGNDRDYYVQWLERQPYLQRINIGTKELAVFENKNPRRLVSTSQNVQDLSLTTGANLDAMQQFLGKSTGQQLNFVNTYRNKKDLAFPVTTIRDIYQDVNQKSVTPNAIEQSLVTGSSPKLYFNTSDAEYKYRLKDGQINILRTIQKDPIVQGNEVTISGRTESSVAAAAYDRKQSYVIETSKGVLPVNPRSTEHNFGLQKEDFSIYRSDRKNLAGDGTFEKSISNTTVKPCQGGSGSDSYVTSTEYKSEGERSLKVTTEDSQRCLRVNIADIKTSELELNFSHLAVGSQKVRYEVKFNDSKQTKSVEELFAKSRWQTLQEVLHVPAGAKSAEITIVALPDYTHRGIAFTYFDDIQVFGLTKLISVPVSGSESFKSVSLSKDQSVKIRHVKNEAVENKNLVANGSFNNGLWQKQVGDCNDYDDRPKIGMRIVDANDGKAIELSARSHTACTSYNDIKVNGNSDYLLSFRYQSPNAKAASYSVRYNDPNNTEESGNVQVKNKEWSTFDRQLRVPINATKMSIIIYAQGDSNGEKTYINNYDDFIVQQLPSLRNMYYYVNNEATGGRNALHVDYEMQGPTKRLVTIKNIKDPTYLTLSQTYNPLWVLSAGTKSDGFLNKLLPMQKAGALPSDQHYAAYDYLNGWYVNPQDICKTAGACTKNTDGSYDMKLVAEFTPQRWVYVGSLISVVTLVACVLFISIKRSKVQSKTRHKDL